MPRERKPRCKHYTGIMNDKCDAGVKYDTVRVERGPGKGYALPCLDDKSEPEAVCFLCEFPTAEELAAEEAEHKKAMADMLKARAAIVTRLGGPWKKGTLGAEGVIDCPCCGGAKTLRFTRSGYNGHIHAACKTEGCVSWME